MSDERDQSADPLYARTAGIPPRSQRRAVRQRDGRLRALAAKGLPAVLVVGGALPMLVGTSGSPNTTRVPSSVLCEGYSRCSAHGFTSHAYGAHRSKSYWRMFAGNECTNYVAYVESTAFHAHTPRYLLGNAGQWPSSARAHGVLVNRTPAVGAVAEWDGGAPGMGSAGHVAVVEKVGPHDRYIDISQQHISSDINGYDWTRINAGFHSGRWLEWPDHFIHFRIARSTGAGVGYFRRGKHSFRLRDSLSAGPPNSKFSLGARGVIPLAGDWTGKGTDGIGYYNPRNGSFHLHDALRAGRSSRTFGFGPAGMIPLAGDWNGKGRDGVGYYDPANGTFHLRNSLSTGKASYTFTFGPAGMIPLAGDWTGGRKDGIGYYDPRNGTFHLRDSLSTGKASYTFKFGPRGMIPLAGDWTGGHRDGIGYYDPHDGWFHLRNSLSAGRDSAHFKFGPGGMIPLAGRWTGA